MDHIDLTLMATGCAIGAVIVLACLLILLIANHVAPRRPNRRSGK